VRGMCTEMIWELVSWTLYVRRVLWYELHEVLLVVSGGGEGRGPGGHLQVD